MESLCEQLRIMRQLFINKNIVHEDLHDGNITITDQGKINLIDLDEVKPIKCPGSLELFSRLDEVMRDLCK